MTTEQFVLLVTRVGDAKDGDTWSITAALLPDQWWTTVGRLMGYDCPETKRPASPFEQRKAREALKVAQEFMAGLGDLWCRVEKKRDDFGRSLATLWHETDDIKTSLGEQLYDLGLATRWPTRWFEVFDPSRNTP